MLRELLFIGMLMKAMRSNGFMWMGFSSRISSIGSMMCCGQGRIEVEDAKKNTRGPCRQLKMAKVTRVTNRRITIGYDDRHRATPMVEQYSALAHDIGHVVQTDYPMQWKSWKATPDEMRTKVRAQLLKKAKANKSNQEKVTILHYSGLRPFSYRMEARWQEIDVFIDVYVRPDDELAESLHVSVSCGSNMVNLSEVVGLCPLLQNRMMVASLLCLCNSPGEAIEFTVGLLRYSNFDLPYSSLGKSWSHMLVSHLYCFIKSLTRYIILQCKLMVEEKNMCV
ncbi:hypothetical protein D8674_012063 [Pyrus ussuriensis x Pyrus communis]|uniref:Uncharacterized protein n=1 Tax=Pyrus ussuriensis x Pyrus communis TaxID=2448454 RepID=A0A5N5G0G6_9ROSA|nr:hypothetical protein D8674_012063 [Pyrus ussuriensis x Pyrus communis]